MEMIPAKIGIKIWIGVNDMKWKDLSNEAKSVIEWVENPLTNRKENIEIQVGVNFKRTAPAYSEEFDGKVDIPMTMKLFSEIIKYVASDDNLETISYDTNINRYVFRIRKDVELH